MKNIFIMFILTLFYGCAATMRATGDCSYKPGWKGRWENEAPTAACKFSLESPIKNVGDAKTFAQSFRLMFNSLPDIDGIIKPEIKMELKEIK